MKKQNFRQIISLLTICCLLFFGFQPVYAASLEKSTGEIKQEETKAFDSVDDTNVESVLKASATGSIEENNSENSIVVKGLEGQKIAKIENIVLPKSRSTCNHIWETVKVIQEGSCELEWIYKIRCTVCMAMATAYTEAPGHNYINGVCAVCGQTEIAPNEELRKWDYVLDVTGGAITLKKYISDAPEVNVYGIYKVDGKQYSTVLNGAENDNGADAPFYEKRNNITSVVIKKGVKSRNCHYMFYNCVKLNSIDLSGLDTSNVTDMQWMFGRCGRLADLDLSGLDTAKVTDMSFMFDGCSSLTSLRLGNFDTARVTDMNSMFYDCGSLSNLDVSNFDTAKVTDMSSMFYDCGSLTDLDVSNFDTAKVTKMKFMFYGCGNLTMLNLRTFNTSNVTDMSEMFFGCSSLESLNLKSFDTAKVTDMNSMFKGCSKLTSLNLSSFHTLNVTNMNSMFQSCSNLTSIYADIDYWDTSKATTVNMFKDCRTQSITLI